MLLLGACSCAMCVSTFCNKRTACELCANVNLQHVSATRLTVNGLEARSSEGGC